MGPSHLGQPATSPRSADHWALLTLQKLVEMIFSSRAGAGENGIVPVGVEFVSFDPKGVHLLLTNLHATLIKTGVNPALMRNPVEVVVLAVRLTINSWLVKCLPRQSNVI